MGNRPPITPEEAVASKIESLPDFVIQAFDETIVKNLAGNRSHFKLKEVAERMRELHAKGDYRLLMTDQSFEARAQKEHWYDVEKIYEDAGWKVVYDGPGFNESYDATFTFTKKK